LNWSLKVDAQSRKKYKGSGGAFQASVWNLGTLGTCRDALSKARRGRKVGVKKWVKDSGKGGMPIQSESENGDGLFVLGVFLRGEGAVQGGS